MPNLPNRHAVEVGVLVSVGNFLIFQHFMPPVADVRAADQFNPLAESSERTALIVATGFTLLVSGFVRSFDTFIIAGAAIVGIDYAYKHAIAVHPDTNTMAGPAGASSNVHPMPAYEDVAQA
jgi:sRNA-binding regulator protein Hfq